MENVEKKYLEGEELDFTEEIDENNELDELEDKKQVIDDKTKRKARFIKRRRARTRSIKKSKLSADAQKRKKEEREKNLGASIRIERKLEYNIIKIKRELAQAK